MMLLRSRIWGVLNTFWELRHVRTRDGLNIFQKKYTLDILREAGFIGCKPASTPMVPGQKLTHSDGKPLPDAGIYRRLVGRLLYLTSTRPDIAFAVQQLSQFIGSPIDKHLCAAHRVLRYLKKVPGRGIWYGAKSNLQLQAFIDVDWAACSETKRFIIGFYVFLGGALVSWKSNKQPTISRPSLEDE